MDTARNPLNLVILDACRNNPFATKFQLAATGLAQIDAPAGTLIAFSTAPGSVASDGSGRNGLYTQHLLREMVKPGAAVEEVFKGVRAAVRKDSGGKQVPWESTSLESGFMFVEAPKAVAPEPPPAKAAASASGKASARSAPAALRAPPAFAKGDRWTYAVRNLLTGAERKSTVRVVEVRAEDVVYENGYVTDHVGNALRTTTGDRITTYSPSNQTYAFPLRSGGNWTLTFVQSYDDRKFDNKVKIAMGGEEDVTTPAGILRAVKLTRTSQWKERGKDNAGTHTMTYWYSGAIKRTVALEQKNVTSSGRVILHERFELERFEVR
jgi:Caspase domain